MIKITGAPGSPKSIYEISIRQSSEDDSSSEINLQGKDSNLLDYLHNRPKPLKTFDTNSTFQAILGILQKIKNEESLKSITRDELSNMAAQLSVGLFSEKSISQNDFDEFVARVNKTFIYISEKLPHPYNRVATKILINSYMVKVSELFKDIHTEPDESPIKLDFLNKLSKRDIKNQQEAAKRFGYTILDYPATSEESALIVPVLNFDFDWDTSNAKTITEIYKVLDLNLQKLCSDLSQTLVFSDRNLIQQGVRVNYIGSPAINLDTTLVSLDFQSPLDFTHSQYFDLTAIHEMNHAVFYEIFDKGIQEALKDKDEIYIAGFGKVAINKFALSVSEFLSHTNELLIHPETILNIAKHQNGFASFGEQYKMFNDFINNAIVEIEERETNPQVVLSELKNRALEQSYKLLKVMKDTFGIDNKYQI